MTEAAFEVLLEENGVTAAASSFYVQFESAAAAAEAKEELQARYQLPEESIQENTAVMGLAGQSSSEAVKNIYGIAFVLFFLVLLAGGADDLRRHEQQCGPADEVLRHAALRRREPAADLPFL